MSFIKELGNAGKGALQGLASGQGLLAGAINGIVNDSEISAGERQRGSALGLPNLALPPYASSSPSFAHNDQMKAMRLKDSHGYEP